MQAPRHKSNDSVSSLINHVRQIAEKCGISLAQLSSQEKISKTKKVFEQHQIQQLNNDPMFVQLSTFIKEQITEECVLTESVRNNYNLLSTMGILEMDSASLAFDGTIIKNNKNTSNYSYYKDFTVDELKDIISASKKQLSDSKSKYELIKKQSELLDNHNAQLNEDILQVDKANDELLNIVVDDDSIDNEGFSEFKSNLEAYRSEVIENIGIILEPIKSSLKNIASTPPKEISLLRVLREDGLLNSTLNNDDSVVQHFAGTLRTHVNINHQMNSLVDVLTKNFIPSLLNKYNVDGNQSLTSFNHNNHSRDRDHDELFNVTRVLSSVPNNDININKDRTSNRDNLIKALLCCLDATKAFHTNAIMSYSTETINDKLCSYLKNYSQIYAELKYNTLVNQAEEIGYLELVKLINSKNVAFWKTQITKFGNKSSHSVDQARDELHGYLISYLKPYMEEKIKIWEVKKTDIIADLIEKDLQPLGPIINFLKETYFNFNKQLENFTNLLVKKEDMLKNCASCLDRILLTLNNRVLKYVSLDEINIVYSQYSTNTNADENDMDTNKRDLLAQTITYLASLYKMNKSDKNSFISEQQMASLIERIRKEAKLHGQITREEYSSLIEEIIKFIGKIKLNEIDVSTNHDGENIYSILMSVLPRNIITALNKSTSVVEESDKKFNDILNEISTKKKMLISDKKIQNKRSELLRFCLEC